MRSTKALSAIVVLFVGLAATASSAASAVARYRYDHGYALNGLGASPGAVFDVGVVTICRSGYAESVRHVSEAEKTRVYAEYAIVRRTSGQYEVDHVVPLELGGNNSIENLWPEPNDHPPGYLNSKDKLENRLHALVCDRRVALVAAQRMISRDWVAEYDQVFGTWPHGSVVARPTTTIPTTTAPPTAGVAVTSAPPSVTPGSTASLTARSPRAHDTCDLTVVLPSGRASTAHGLGAATADARGVVSWTWTIGSNTHAGTATATVSCGAGSARRTFTVL
ncbi:MAG TPA: HNH endonuclease signature motif containing protein [Acidimicrobiales bacterium]|nr:HNH endonuclease signature motif containing protein [Acidimicrobiales bacterium]HVC26450.1 HNH endonuclease signature motif containing protein [Acidimicrobiales bacterium]